MKQEKYLIISKDVKIPLNVVTKRLAFLGTTGSGKSYAAMKLAEELLYNGIQTIILDPVGIHWGLRLSSNGKGKGISITVFGGLYGDVPITPTSGAIIADTIIDKNISAVIDVSQFEYDTDKAKFASAFAQRFFFRKKAKPSPVHIILEEAQEFIPQNPEREETTMLHHYIRMWKIGRNFGIGGSIVSQRPQEINKKALNLSQCVFAFQTSGHHERKAIEDWIKDKGLNLDIAADLPKLPIGEPHLWSPGWLGVSQKIKISARTTFHPSEEETVSYEPGRLNKLSPVDIKKLSESIAETIEKAKENDPSELKKKIRELELSIQKNLKSQPVPDLEGNKRQAEFLNKKIEEISTHYEQQFQKFVKEVTLIKNAILKNTGSMKQAIQALEEIKIPDGSFQQYQFKEYESNYTRIKIEKTSGQVLHHGSHYTVPDTVSIKKQINTVTLLPNEKLIAGAMRMLSAVCTIQTGLNMQQVRVLADISDPSTFSRYKTTLTTNGYWREENKKFYPTTIGINFAQQNNIPTVPVETDKIVELWMNNLIDGARRMLRVLISFNGEFIDKETLMEHANITDPSTYSRYKTTLVSNCLARTNGNQIAANKETLFL